MEENSQFRDVFNRESVSGLGNRIASVYPSFETENFIESILEDFEDLTLSERNLKICWALKSYLPDDFTEAVAVLLESQTEELEADKMEGTRGFIVMPQTLFISENGMDYFELSMYALEEMTKRFTSEFAIRYFLIEHPEKTLNQMKKWSLDTNCHVRRLASEGSRPRLPWSMRLNNFIQDPTPVIEILELMKFSKERLVERSIANNLNDIAKDNPDTVCGLLLKWQKEGVSDWLINHSLRTLFKQGNPQALKLCGFDPDAQVNLTAFKLNSAEIEFGKTLDFSFNIHSKSPQRLMVDYIVHHMKANGKLAPKVFKMTKKTICGQELLSKKHSIRSISTRKYYPGKHLLQIQINGKIFVEQEFYLKM